MKRLLPLSLALGLAASSLAPSSAFARIKLITLPVRERVEIQLDNPSATLVEEERVVPLTKGVNQVDFSWANTQIDPNTIVFRVLGPVGAKAADKAAGKEGEGQKNEPDRKNEQKSDKPDNQSKKNPDDAGKKGEGDNPDPAGDQKPDNAGPLDVKVLSVSYPPNEAALVWQVASSASGSARVRISYLLGNLNKSFNYRAVAARDEKTLTLSQYMRLQNLANEQYAAGNLWAGFGKHFLRPIGINETKEMLAAKYENVPIKKTYTCNVQEFGYLDEPQKKLRVPMHYVLKNDAGNKLGDAPLQAGKVRIFQDDGHGSTAFLGEDIGHYTPRDDEMRLYLGVAQDIVVKRTVDKNELHRVAGNLYNREIILKYEIENFKDKPVTLDLVENLPFVRNELHGATNREVQWELGKLTTFKGGPDPEHSTSDQVMFHADLPARGKDGKAEKIVHKLQLTIMNEW